MLLVAAAVALTAAVSRTLMPDAFGTRSGQASTAQHLPLSLAQAAAPGEGPAVQEKGSGAIVNADRELALMLLPGLLEMGVAVPAMGPDDDGQAVLKAVNGLRRSEGLPLFEQMDQTVADYVDVRVDQYRKRRANVLRAQIALDALGFDAGPIDGVLGPQTTAAIRRYQQRAGLPVTGELTAEQIDALEVRSFDRAARRRSGR
jgi:hypothetical protein